MAKQKRVHKQAQLPGHEKSGHPAVEEAADEVREAIAEVKAVTRERDAKIATLVNVMKEHGVTEYEFDEGEHEKVIVNHKVVDKILIRTKRKAPPKGAVTENA